MHQTKRHFAEALAATFPQREAEQLMRILLEDLFGIDLKSQLMEPDLRIDEWQYHQLDEAVKRLLSGEPVQYVTGMARFCDLLIKVSPAVLIPRPETEELVQKICTTISKEKPIRIWDIGTGSGCIAIALSKHFENAEVIAFDVSKEALKIAKENAESNDVQVTFVHDDVLHPTSEFFSQPVDLVVSNPPYVCDSERAAMDYLKAHTLRCVVKSKTARKGSVEVNAEIRLKDDNTDFINALSDLNGVNSAVLVSYNGDYMG